MDVTYHLLISPLKVLHRVLNSHSLGISLDLTNAFIHLRIIVYEFLGIINLMSLTTIFTNAHIAILLLSLNVFFFLLELILQLCCYYCFLFF